MPYYNLLVSTTVPTTVRQLTFSNLFALSVVLSYLDTLDGFNSDSGTCDSKCQCTTVNKRQLNLTALKDPTILVPPQFSDVLGQDKYYYSYQPCGRFSQQFSVDCTNVALCQTITHVNFYDVGTLPATLSGEPEDNNLVLQYSSFTGTRHSFIKLVCDPNIERKFDAIGEETPGSKRYDFVYTTKYACFPAPTSGGLGTGSAMLIVFFVLVIVYIVGGMLFLRYARGARGIEQIPNFEFWREIPGLIKDGAKFTLNGCKGDTTYSQI